jgi:hypothetical protein
MFKSNINLKIYNQRSYWSRARVAISLRVWLFVSISCFSSFVGGLGYRAVYNAREYNDVVGNNLMARLIFE